MRRLAVILAAAAAFFVAAVTARAEPIPPPPAISCLPADGCWVDPYLSKVASVFAMRPTRVDCYTEKAWNASPIYRGAWGVTWMIGSDSIEIYGPLCVALDRLRVGQVPVPWRAGVGLLVVTHESYHARWWDLRGNEAAVECRAVRHGRAALGLLLGHDDPALWKQLRPWVLMAHWRLVRRNPQYYEASCHVPSPW